MASVKDPGRALTHAIADENILPAKPLKKKRSLKQLLIPSRQRSLRSLKQPPAEAPITSHEAPPPLSYPNTYLKPLQTSSTPPSNLSNDSASNGQRQSSKQIDGSIILGTEQLIHNLQTADDHRPMRPRAGTVQNFSRNYGALQERTLHPSTPSPQPRLRAGSTVSPGPSTLEISPDWGPQNSVNRSFSAGPPSNPLPAASNTPKSAMKNLSASFSNSASSQLYELDSTPILAASMRHLNPKKSLSNDPSPNQSRVLVGHSRHISISPVEPDIRESTQSGRSIYSSTLDTKHSSTFTKISATTDTTVDAEFADEHKDSMTVDDAIDLYVAGFEDDETPEADGVNGVDTGMPITNGVEDVEVVDKTLDTNGTQEKDDGSPNASGVNETDHETRLRANQITDALTGTIGETKELLNLTTTASEAPLQSFSNSVLALSGTDLQNSFHKPPTLQRPTVTHDIYGFRKFSRDVALEAYDAWYAEYSKFQARRTAKWVAFLQNQGLPTRAPARFPTKSAKVQRYIRKGIPPSWRGEAWFYYSRGNDLLLANPNRYTNLVVKSQTAAMSRNDKESIERDLHRTFPDNVHFKSESSTNTPLETPIMSALRPVLSAFAHDHPRIGYCQSLNFIAGLLLLFLPEEKAYWMLYIITTRHLPGTHDVSLEGANVDLWVMMLALKEANPNVWSKVGGGDVSKDSRTLPPITLCTTSWFMSVFIGSLPIESVLRVWDVLFYEGSKTLFRVAVGIFKSGEGTIKAVHDPVETFQLVQTLPRKMLDVGRLFDLAFSRGEVGRKWIEKKRQERKDVYAKDRAAEKVRKESRDMGRKASDARSLKESMWSPASFDDNDVPSPDEPIRGNQNNYGNTGN